MSDAEHKMRFVSPGAGSLGIALDKHEKLPDVILFAPASNVLYLIEAVTSAGPMDEARVKDLRARLLPDTLSFGVEFFTAFPDRKTFRGFVERIAWGTSVWIADEPTGVVTFRKIR